MHTTPTSTALAVVLHGIGTNKLSTMSDTAQAGITEVGNQHRRQGHEGVFT